MGHRPSIESMQRHLSEPIREHFWSGHEEKKETESSRESTTMGVFLDHLYDQIDRLDGELQERLYPLVDEIEEKMTDYVIARIGFSRASRQFQDSSIDVQSRQAVLKEVDMRRTFGHNALLDAIQIATRNIVQAFESVGETFTPLPAETHALVTPSVAGYRQLVARAAIDFVWRALEDEERAMHNPPSPPTETV